MRNTKSDEMYVYDYIVLFVKEEENGRVNKVFVEMAQIRL